jgi:hypothetical protein
LLSALYLTAPARAAKTGESVPTPDALAQLEDRANHADPRERPYLYTELVHAMTEQASKQIAAGDSNAAAATLKQVNRLAQLIQASLARNTKRLKDAEEQMHNTTYRLGQLLHLVPADDQPAVKQTLQQLDQVNDALLTQVFQH